MEAEKELDTGGTLVFFGEQSRPDYTGITDEQRGAHEAPLRRSATAGWAARGSGAGRPVGPPTAVAFAQASRASSR